MDPVEIPRKRLPHSVMLAGLIVLLLMPLAGFVGWRFYSQRETHPNVPPVKIESEPKPPTSPGA